MLSACVNHAPQPINTLVLKPVKFDSIPSWDQSFRDDLEKEYLEPQITAGKNSVKITPNISEVRKGLIALVDSCRALALQPQDQIIISVPEKIVKVADFRDVCDLATVVIGMKQNQIRRFFETWFEPFLVINPMGDFQAYYQNEPEVVLKASSRVIAKHSVVFQNFIPAGIPLWFDLRLHSSNEGQSELFQQIVVSHENIKATSSEASEGLVKEIIGKIYFGKNSDSVTKVGTGQYYLLLPIS